MMYNVEFGVHVKYKFVKQATPEHLAAVENAADFKSWSELASANSRTDTPKAYAAFEKLKSELSRRADAGLFTCEHVPVLDRLIPVTKQEIHDFALNIEFPVQHDTLFALKSPWEVPEEISKQVDEGNLRSFNCVTLHSGLVEGSLMGEFGIEVIPEFVQEECAAVRKIEGHSKFEGWFELARHLQNPDNAESGLSREVEKLCVQINKKLGLEDDYWLKLIPISEEAHAMSYARRHLPYFGVVFKLDGAIQFASHVDKWTDEDLGRPVAQIFDLVRPVV